MAEIRRSPVEVGSLSHYLQGFIHPNGGCLGFQPSTVPTVQTADLKKMKWFSEGILPKIVLLQVWTNMYSLASHFLQPEDQQH